MYNESFQRDNLFYNEVLDQIKQCYVIMANSILKQEEKTMDFTKLFQIPFELQKDEDILKNEFAENLSKCLASDSEFETSYLASYDSLKDVLSKMSLDAKKEMIPASMKFVCICLKK